MRRATTPTHTFSLPEDVPADSLGKALLTIPVGVTAIGANFMYNCKKVTALVVNSPSSNSALTSSNNSLATNDNTAPMYTTGVTVTGSQAARWKNRLSDRSSSPYRKLILGT